MEGKDAKYRLADTVRLLLESIETDTVEITRPSNLVIQVKVREANGAPRYFNVTVSEML